MVKLKPCPFCGGKAAYIAQNYMGQHYVRCPDCGCTMWGLDTDEEVTEKQAAAYWNKRKDVRPVPEGGIGEMSDGYHTFNGLYYQRMVLFAALVKAYKDKAWKSWKHEDGELCFGGGWFIVGIDTPRGSYTYHYEAKDFDLFDCEELPVAKHWDGHTEEDVTRLLSLDVRSVVRGKWNRTDAYPHRLYCSVCYKTYLKNDELLERWEFPLNFCPNCGADMREES